MDVTLTPATPADRELLASLMNLYMYDFSEFTAHDSGDDGVFRARDIDQYFADPRETWIARADGHLAGFVIVRRDGVALDGTPDVRDMQEFFVMRKYRHRGVGEKLARRTFERYRGQWQVRVMRENTPAQSFWRAVIGRYADRFEERDWDEDRWRGPVFRFGNT
jgi:predicted acetyltransferase